CTPANSPKRRPPTHLLHHCLTPEISRMAKPVRLD
ncbi:xanthomonadin biosynthesis protein, partial [Xanthomonas campestris pv. raphani]